MARMAPYDEIADWYEDEFLAKQRAHAAGNDFADEIGLDRSLHDLLGTGTGTCLEIGCGTGVYADRVRKLGWTPIGIDISSGMLRRALARLPVVQADVAQLPFADGSLAAVIAMMAHTDMPNYPSALQEVRRVLRPGGVFVHVGVHPCFCGGFADRSNVDAVVIRPGYLDGHWTTNSWTTQGLRDKVGAQHLPLPALLNAFVDAGLSLQEFTEGGATCPVTLAVKALKSIRHEP